MECKTRALFVFLLPSSTPAILFVDQKNCHLFFITHFFLSFSPFLLFLFFPLLPSPPFLFLVTGEDSSLSDFAKYKTIRRSEGATDYSVHETCYLRYATLQQLLQLLCHPFRSCEVLFSLYFYLFPFLSSFSHSSF